MTAQDAGTLNDIQPRRSGVVSWFTQNWNVQTVIAVGAVAFAAASTFFTTGYKIERLEEFKVAHEAYHDKRANELAELAGRNDQRFAGIDAQLRRVDELTFRVARADESISSTKEAIGKLEGTVNSLISDIRVMREILERMDSRRIITPRTNSH
ncbi:hypothetical protein NS365_01075 [Aureimonas ureilytica]|uniref:Uncharacterized protein n=1 Tax=Aureimonas ureilytica TaxID=401562 RepID=A0A147DBK9_9HYPH|nr:hypothetical protein [Aureimonas ureilytica]KTR08558.1 hypothetical protein NS365_01075 [Aureimonas ureilytica]